MRWTRKARCFFPLALGIVLTDCATKRVAEATLAPAHVPHPVFGDIVRFTLTYNPGAAMSLSLGITPGWASRSWQERRCCCSECSIIVYHRTANSPRQHLL